MSADVNSHGVLFSFYNVRFFTFILGLVLFLLLFSCVHIYPDFRWRSTCLIFGTDPAALAALSPEKAAFMEALPDGPALKPPPGVIPDFANLGGHHETGYAVVISCSILATIAVAVRLYSRDAIKDLKLEDGRFNQRLYNRPLTSLGLLVSALVCKSNSQGSVAETLTVFP